MFNVHITLDLGDPDRMAEIVPDGGSGIDKGICHVLEGFGIFFTAMME